MAELAQSSSEATPVGASSYLRVIHVAAARNTQWRPDLAQQLMTSLFALQERLVLVIHATASAISWSIEVAHPLEDAITKTIYGLYPHVQMEAAPKQVTTVGWYRFDFETAAPFIGPLLTVTEFGKADPLAQVLSTLSTVGEGEQLRVELSLSPVNQEIYKLGEKLSSQSLTQWWHFLTVGGAVAAATRKAFGADEVKRYTPTLQRLIDDKLNAPLKMAVLSVKVLAKSPQRANELIIPLIPSLAIYERNGSNYLTAPFSESFPLVLSAPEAAALWHLPSEQCQQPGIVWAASTRSSLPVSLKGRQQGIKLGINRYQNQAAEVWLSYPDRVTHVNVVGKTRTGKSTLLHHLIHQDIAAGKGVAVIDPHGQLIDSILATSIPPEREHDVVVFDAQDSEYPIGLNLLSRQPGISSGVVVGQVMAVIRKLFAENWSSSRMEDALHAALVTALAVEGATIQTIPRLFYDSAFRAQALQQVRDPMALEFWFDEYEPLGAAYQREFARPVANRLRKFYRNEAIRPIVLQPTSLDFRELVAKRQIFLARLSGLPDLEAETLGALLISKFQMAAMSHINQDQQALSEYYLYIDEVQRFVVTSLSQMFSEAAKFGLSLIVAHQYLKQLEGNTLESLMGNVGATIMFRTGPQDAQALAPFVRPQHSSDDLLNLDRFVAIVKMQLEGKTLPAFSLETVEPLLLPEDAPERQQRIRDASRTRYARPRAVVEAELISKYSDRLGSQPDTDESEVSYFG
jgi:hypothetical protein